MKLKHSTLRHTGYEDIGEFWRDAQFDETPRLQEDIERLWQELRPMYLQLHAFVRKRLKSYYAYKYDKFPDDGSIPVHLLGSFLCTSFILAITVMSIT